MDGKSFTLFIKHVNELRTDVLDNPNHKLTPDSFLIFLDKIKNLTHSHNLNELIIRKISQINVDELRTKRMLNLFQQHSLDFKFEENLRLGEIRQFAQEVIPKPRFLFDQYKTSESQLDISDSEEITEEQAKKPEEDYFSFFSSHEKVILKPESNFKNLRQFMEFLPIDYYILLQEGYDEVREPVKSNHVFYTNLPLLVKKRSYLKEKTDIIKNITFEDILRCLDKHEAEKILSDTFAQEELVDHLSKHYGSIKQLFHINYDPEEILTRFMNTTKNVGSDQIQQFEEALSKAIDNQNVISSEHKDLSQRIEESSFEDLLKLCKEDLESAKESEETAEGKKKAKKSTNVENVIEDLKKKERKMLGLDRQIQRSGFIVFEDRISKLQMMQTPLFLFGMKLFRQDGHLEFFDADFCNTILVKSQPLVDLTLRDVCNIINEMLVKSGFEGNLLKIGKLKDLEDFDLGKILVRQDYQISLRFNTFYDALEAY